MNWSFFYCSLKFSIHSLFLLSQSLWNDSIQIFFLVYLNRYDIIYLEEFMWKPFFIVTNFTVERSEIVKEIGQEKTDEEKGKRSTKKKRMNWNTTNLFVDFTFLLRRCLDFLHCSFHRSKILWIWTYNFELPKILNNNWDRLLELFKRLH